MHLTSSDPIEGSKDIMNNITSRTSLNKISKERSKQYGFKWEKMCLLIKNCISGL